MMNWVWVQWLKRNWKWIVLPIGVLLWLLGRGSKRTEVKVVSPALTEHAKVKSVAEMLADQERARSAATRDQRVAEVNAKSDAELEKIAAASAQRQATLEKQSPEDVNVFLKGVGKQVRNEKT